MTKPVSGGPSGKPPVACVPRSAPRLRVAVSPRPPGPPRSSLLTLDITVWRLLDDEAGFRWSSRETTGGLRAALRPASPCRRVAASPRAAAQYTHLMNRRQFLYTSAAGLALSATGYAGSKPRRVSLIGSGWYGKSDLFRLIQVAPVEVVSLCDVDKQMLARAAGIAATRQASKKKPRTYSDYREMLKEKDLDIVLIATPDHWHALPMIAAVEAGADVYVQKPISVDMVEGQAMLAAARKHQRVVQVGTQRRSTPHLVEARDRFIKEGKLGKIALVEMCCYYHMRRHRQSARTPIPRTTSTRTCGLAPRPCVPTTAWYTRAAGARSWNTATASWATWASTCSTWCAGCWIWAGPNGSSSGAASWSTSGPKPTSPTRRPPPSTIGDLKLVWQHRTWGAAPIRSQICLELYLLRR